MWRLRVELTSACVGVKDPPDSHSLPKWIPHAVHITFSCLQLTHTPHGNKVHSRACCFLTQVCRRHLNWHAADDRLCKLFSAISNRGDGPERSANAGMKHFHPLPSFFSCHSSTNLMWVRLMTCSETGNVAQTESFSWHTFQTQLWKHVRPL